MKTIEEIFEEYIGETSIADAVWDIKYNKALFKEIETDLVDYNEGNVTESTVFKYLPENRFFELSYTTNSWDDYDDDEEHLSADDIIEVFPTEKTIIVYLPKSELK